MLRVADESHGGVGRFAAYEAHLLLSVGLDGAVALPAVFTLGGRQHVGIELHGVAVGRCGNGGKRMPERVERLQVAHGGVAAGRPTRGVVIGDGRLVVKVDVELMPVSADGVSRLSVLGSDGGQRLVLLGDGHQSVSMVGSQLLLREVDITSVAGELALAHRFRGDKSVRLIIHIERQAADMVFQHVCPLYVIVVDEGDVEARRTVVQAFGHHVATIQCQCSQHGHNALLYDESNVHCRLDVRFFVYEFRTSRSECGVPKAGCVREQRYSTPAQSGRQE